MKDLLLVLMTGLYIRLLIPVPLYTKISTEIKIKTGRNAILRKNELFPN